MPLPSHELCFWMFLISTVVCTSFAYQQPYAAAAAGYYNGNGRWKLKNNNNKYPVIYVDPFGHGHFRTIQAAIDSVPQYNKKWICIHVRAGTYREQVNIPREKPYIYLRGEAQRRTNVIWDGHDSIEAATFSCDADNTFVKSITFINSYNFPPEHNRNPRRVAVAAMLSGDKMAFFRCGFKGWQDTLWDVHGRHYFKKCSINGAVDFIFGNGQSIYEGCSISVDRGGEEGMIGYITAQGRQEAGESSGFVFKNCHVHGNGKAYLGRPWRDYARVIFYRTYLEDNVVPQGWTSYATASGLNKLTFVEHGCSGPGSNRSMRVKWLAELGGRELRYFTSLSYIDNDGWLRKLPRSKIFA
ncbi:PREDICTED: probable pectinesterase 29 [Ipomoea nil]|uniref:probable pectinesterase 29 n=1 Tax=Ipomoea nil TaxID=35883 RepID=UPI000901E87B|nr:PREDICTED: probable pectinesterase 29 [Ipomoea nil]